MSSINSPITNPQSIILSSTIRNKTFLLCNNFSPDLRNL